MAGQLRRATPRRSAGWHFDYGRRSQLSGEPPHEQAAADAMGTSWRGPSIAVSVCGLQRRVCRRIDGASQPELATATGGSGSKTARLRPSMRRCEGPDAVYPRILAAADNQVPEAQLEAQIPANAQDDDLAVDVPPPEQLRQHQHL